VLYSVYDFIINNNMGVKGWITIHVYIHTVNNHTIKYESMSLVVGEAIAYKRVF